MTSAQQYRREPITTNHHIELANTLQMPYENAYLRRLTAWRKGATDPDLETAFISIWNESSYWRCWHNGLIND